MATLGELADSVSADNVAITTDQASITSIEANLTAAQAMLASNQTKLAEDNTKLGAALATTGGFFRVNSDGTATVYEPDGSGGVIVKTLKPDSTPAP